MVTKKIYIAEDQEEIRECVQELLEAEGYITEGFENGDMLLEKFREISPDLVILDIVMPGSTGYKVCKEIRKTSKVPIVMLTARESDLDQATAMELRE